MYSTLRTTDDEVSSLGHWVRQISHAYKVINVEYDRGRTAHSFLVGIAASLGLPALMAMLLFLWNQFRGLLRHRAAVRSKSTATGENSWLAEQALTLFIFQFLSLVTRSAQMFDWASLRYSQHLFGRFATTKRIVRVLPELYPHPGVEPVWFPQPEPRTNLFQSQARTVPGS